MSNGFQYSDDLGPEKILHLYDPALGLKAIVVVDNVACGPSIGGVRMAEDVSLEECFRLARAMTLKNAIAQIPHGGGKSVIFGNPRMPAEEKEHWIRSFARAIARITEYIPGPDMGTNEHAMALTRDEIGRSVGLPREIGGIPLDEIGATAFGLVAAGDAAQAFCDVRLDGARVVIEGFGAVGRHAARFLSGRGSRIIAVADSRGGTVNRDGLDIDALSILKAEGESVTAYNDGETIGTADLIDIECDIWIPAARPDVIHGGNVDRLKTKLVLGGANIPLTVEAETILHERGVLVVPDFIANAGGVICASVEYHGGTESAALSTIEEKLAANTRAVLEKARSDGVAPRVAAETLARTRVLKAMSYRRTG